MILRNFSLSFGIGLLLLGTLPRAEARAQSPSSPQAQSQPEESCRQSRPPKRVWANDDLASLRKPWDTYQEQKAAEEAARAGQQAEAAKQAKGAKSDTAAAANPGPQTVEEAESLLRDKREEIGYQVDLIRQTQREYNSASEDYIKQWLQKKLDMQNADLESATTELHELEAHLEQLKAKQQRPQALSSSARAGSW